MISESTEHYVLKTFIAIGDTQPRNSTCCLSTTAAQEDQMLHWVLMNSRQGMMTETASQLQDSIGPLVIHKMAKKRLYKMGFKIL